MSVNGWTPVRDETGKVTRTEWSSKDLAMEMAREVERAREQRRNKPAPRRATQAAPDDSQAVLPVCVDPEPSSKAASTAVLCQKRGCGLPALMGRMGKFCGNTHKAWVLDHPEDDVRKEHFCLRRKGTRRALDRRLSRQGLLLLGRLQKGPASNLELVQAGAGFRYSARIHEARELGHDIRLIEQDHETGRTVYALYVNGEVVK